MDITAKHDSGSLGIVIEHHVETIVRDGTVLCSNVYRPDDGARYPGLLTRTPYCKDQEGLGLARYAAYVRAGYAVVVQDSRGRYESDGDFIPQYVADTGDAEDGYDSVEWLAAQARAATPGPKRGQLHLQPARSRPYPVESDAVFGAWQPPAPGLPPGHPALPLSAADRVAGNRG